MVFKNQFYDFFLKPTVILNLNSERIKFDNFFEQVKFDNYYKRKIDNQGNGGGTSRLPSWFSKQRSCYHFIYFFMKTTLSINKNLDKVTYI